MRKLTWLVVGLYLSMCFAGITFAAVPLSFAESIVAMEKTVYGQEKSGPFVERVEALETIIYGRTSTMPVPDKIARLSKTLDDNAEQASLPLVLKYAEAQIFQRVDSGPILPRVNRLEERLTGKQDSGALGQRLEKILKTAFANGTVIVSDSVVNSKTLVKIRLLDTLNSDKNHTGDTFRYEVASHVIVGSNLVIPAGSAGTGKIEKAKAAGRFGKHGKLDLGFNSISAIDGTQVPLYLGEVARAENKHVIAAAGASVAGAVILGPIGLIGGAFIEGKTAVLQVGTEFYIEVQTDTNLRGAGLGERVTLTDPVLQVEPNKPPVASIQITK
jgi:hypothetical protein